MPHRVLITGGAGFIGSHLADQLLARGHAVTVLDNLSPQVHAEAETDDQGWPTYLDRRVRRLRGDVCDPEDVAAALDGVDQVAHLAASVGVGQSMTQIVDYTRVNALGAAVVLEAVSRAPDRIGRLVVASSMSIYGEGAYRRPSTGAPAAAPYRSRDQLAARQWEPTLDGETLEPIPTDENKRLEPTSIYAIGKRDHEEMFLSVGRALGIPTIALRLFNVYGSRQALSNPYTGVAAIFVSRLLNGEPPLVFEDGGQRRDFVHVLDVAGAFVAALESDAPVSSAYNVGSGRSVTVLEIAEVLGRQLGRPIAPEVLGRYRVGDIRHCFADIGRIEAALGVTPKRDFEAGMAELIAWVRQARAPKDRSAQSLGELERGKLLV